MQPQWTNKIIDKKKICVTETGTVYNIYINTSKHKMFCHVTCVLLLILKVMSFVTKTPEIDHDDIIKSLGNVL